MRFRADKATVEEVVAEMIELNPHLTREGLMRCVHGVDPEDASWVMGHVDWRREGIKVLPESIGDLTVDGDLLLYSTNLVTLPASFGRFTCMLVEQLFLEPLEVGECDLECILSLEGEGWFRGSAQGREQRTGNDDSPVFL